MIFEIVYLLIHLVFTSRIICLRFVEGIIVPVKVHEAIPMPYVPWLAEWQIWGGVCFYVQCNINSIPRFDMSIDQLENLCIEIRKPRSKPVLVTWYRPPNSPVDKFNYFETLVGRLDAENVEYYLMVS